MDQETFVVAIEDLVDASEHEAEPVVAEAIALVHEAEALALVHEAEAYALIHEG
jgi:hypothetical protein